MLIRSPPLRVFPTHGRIHDLQNTIRSFLSCPSPPAKGLVATSRALVLPHSSSARIEKENAPCSDSAEPAVGQADDGERPSCMLGPQQSPGPGVVGGGPELGSGSIPPSGYFGHLSLYGCLK
ncbi:hypothetical protein E2C01_093769 [Portunus trituberculatus]|uniref:Uncharacterized protein n=1 Tax=Portunus trituberculatus TaxID=210409 RepID=A0A5B7JNL0_PORTR|nr:hypothetical protein [Portunus trituberculatus]